MFCQNKTSNIFELPNPKGGGGEEVTLDRVEIRLLHSTAFAEENKV
jgi:hypothetical protein